MKTPEKISKKEILIPDDFSKNIIKYCPELTEGSTHPETHEHYMGQSKFLITHNLVDCEKYPGHRFAKIKTWIKNGDILDPFTYRKIEWYYGNTDSTYLILEGLQAENEKNMKIIERVRAHEYRENQTRNNREYSHILLIPPLSATPKYPSKSDRLSEYCPGEPYYERHQEFIKNFIEFFRKVFYGNKPKIIPLGFSISALAALDTAFQNREIHKVGCFSPSIQLLKPTECLFPRSIEGSINNNVEIRKHINILFNHEKAPNTSLSRIEIHINMDEIGKMEKRNRDEASIRKNLSLMEKFHTGIPKDSAKNFGTSTEKSLKVCGIDGKDAKRLNLDEGGLAVSCLAEMTKDVRHKTEITLQNPNKTLKTHIYPNHCIKEDGSEINPHSWLRWGEMMDDFLKNESKEQRKEGEK